VLMAQAIQERKFGELVENKEIKDLVAEEFEQIKYRNIDKDGKIEIEPKELIKEKIGRSPDDWDSIMMRYYFELTPKADLWLG